MNPAFKFLPGLVLCLSAVSGCQRAVTGPPVPPPPPVVFVASPAHRSITDSEDYPGRLVAAEIVEVSPRVTGYIERVQFKDGDRVQAGDVLFQIDARPYQAELDRAVAALQQARTQLERAQSREQRVRSLYERNAISDEELETATFARQEAESAVASAEASERLARLNLEFTQITARISGQISRRLVDPGNLVKADETKLATIVATDPIYAYFSIDERTLLRLQRLIQAGTLVHDEHSRFSVQIALADETDYSRTGLVTFLDNQLDSTTGTLTARATISNSDGFLTPGLFVRMRTPIGSPYPALVIPEEALASDQGQRFVYVVNDKDEVEYRRVVIGKAVDGQRVISEGLQAGERVVVKGLQRVKPGQKVDAQPLEAQEPAETASGERPAAAAATAR